MDLKIISNNKNELLKRKEIIAELEEKTIPSKKVIKQKLSAMIDVPEDRVVIQKVETKFGSPHARVIAKAYDSPEDMKKLSRRYVLARNFEEFKKKKGAKKETAPGPGKPAA